MKVFLKMFFVVGVAAICMASAVPSCMTRNDTLTIEASDFDLDSFVAKPTAYFLEEVDTGKFKKYKLKLIEPRKINKNFPADSVVFQYVGQRVLYSKKEIKKAYKQGFSVGENIDIYSAEFNLPLYVEYKIPGEDKQTKYITDVDLGAPHIDGVTSDSFIKVDGSQYPLVATKDSRVNLDISYLGAKVKMTKDSPPVEKYSMKLNGWLELPVIKTKDSATNTHIEKLPVKFDKKNVISYWGTRYNADARYFKIDFTVPQAARKKILKEGQWLCLVIDNGIGIDSTWVFVQGEKEPTDADRF